MNNIDHTPKWGGSIFYCKFCGKPDMQWVEIEPNIWKPFDLINNSIHYCNSKIQKKLHNNAKAEMQEIYNGMSDYDGEDSYLGDGIWIERNGDLKHN